MSCFSSMCRALNACLHHLAGFIRALLFTSTRNTASNGLFAARTVFWFLASYLFSFVQHRGIDVAKV